MVSAERQQVVEVGTAAVAPPDDVVEFAAVVVHRAAGDRAARVEPAKGPALGTLARRSRAAEIERARGVDHDPVAYDDRCTSRSSHISASTRLERRPGCPNRRADRQPRPPGTRRSPRRTQVDPSGRRGTTRRTPAVRRRALAGGAASRSGRLDRCRERTRRTSASSSASSRAAILTPSTGSKRPSKRHMPSESVQDRRRTARRWRSSRAMPSSAWIERTSNASRLRNSSTVATEATSTKPATRSNSSDRCLSSSGLPARVMASTWAAVTSAAVEGVGERGDGRQGVGSLLGLCSPRPTMSGWTRRSPARGTTPGSTAAPSAPRRTMPATLAAATTLAAPPRSTLGRQRRWRAPKRSPAPARRPHRSPCTHDDGRVLRSYLDLSSGLFTRRVGCRL